MLRLRWILRLFKDFIVITVLISIKIMMKVTNVVVFAFFASHYLELQNMQSRQVGEQMEHGCNISSPRVPEQF